MKENIVVEDFKGFTLVLQPLLFHKEPRKSRKGLWEMWFWILNRRIEGYESIPCPIFTEWWEEQPAAVLSPHSVI